MSPKLIAVLVAAVVLPVAAQSAAPRAEPRPTSQVQEDKAKADGKVTPKERARLAKSQNKQARKIAKQKHDAQKKPPAG